MWLLRLRADTSIGRRKLAPKVTLLWHSQGRGADPDGQRHGGASCESWVGGWTRYRWLNSRSDTSAGRRKIIPVFIAAPMRFFAVVGAQLRKQQPTNSKTALEDSADFRSAMPVGNGECRRSGTTNFTSVEVGFLTHWSRVLVFRGRQVNARGTCSVSAGVAGVTPCELMRRLGVADYSPNPTLVIAV